jgi:hypothetical protein
VAARKGRSWYRARKFVARHRIGLAVATFFVMVIGVAAFMLLTQVRETVRQSTRAQSATKFLVEAFRAADPQKALGENITAKQILDQAQRSLQLELGNEPELRAELLARIAEVKLHLSSPGDALVLIRAGLIDYARAERPDADMRATLLELEVRAAEYAGQYDVAEDAIAQATKAGGSCTDALERSGALVADLRGRQGGSPARRSWCRSRTPRKPVAERPGRTDQSGRVPQGQVAPGAHVWGDQSWQ